MDNTINQSSEQWEKKISKLESLKVFLQKKYISLALLAALTGGWAFVGYQAFKDKEIENVKDLQWYPFEKHHLVFRDDNGDFFAENLQLKRETLAPGVEIIRDAWLIFYVVQKEDIKEVKNTIYVWKKTKVKQWKKTITKKVKVPKITITHIWDFEKIRGKLVNIPEFSYLKNTNYDRSNPNNKIKSFNIPKESVTSGMYIPIPLDYKVREISPQDFANYCYDAIQEMKSDSNVYVKEIKELLSYASEKDVITAMLAFARSETTTEYTKFVKPIGNVELHRRERTFKSFSFTYFHILMEKNADGKTPGPGLEARLKLWLTEWQCYHPKNSAKLFLAYRIEKTNGHLKKIFPLTEDNIKEVGKKYNWSSTYVDKLQPNYTYCKKLMNGKITPDTDFVKVPKK